MSENLREQEVKIYMPDLESLRQKLNSIGASISAERVYERNVRYDDDNTRLTNSDMLLRLREDSRVRLTYKSPSVIERGISTRDEFEVEVSDFETMQRILDQLGYKPYMVYEKYRTTYQLNEVEIVLDELPYGNFIEIEGIPSEIETALTLLDLASAERIIHSYARLFEFVKHHLELNFQDLTFENFEKVAVPVSAFIPPGSIVIR